jgi:anti-sigma regulatory factor (Ser/Thr protein kinase)
MKTLEQRFRLQVPSSPENLSMIRAFVARVGEQAGLPEEEIGKLELAVDEACANVMEHAYGGDAAQDVAVRAEFDEDAVRITIVDTGRGFDPANIPQEDLAKLVAERKTGGLGLRLIKTLMDEVRYEIEPGKQNELQMVKRLRKA